MIKVEMISNHLNKYDFDLRKSQNGRWIDQKCTPDVVTIVSDCIIEYLEAYPDDYFTSLDIWHFDYTEENVKSLFNKPSVNNKKSSNEYDKFFAQPLKMLANANILKESKKGNKNIYSVINYDLLKYISFREKNSLIFMQLYIEKVLKDSGLWSYFNDFFIYQDKTYFDRLKSHYEQFIIKYTKINKPTEVRRIFTKVLNPLSNKFHKKGTKRGRISPNMITYSDLMYNNENFRDLYSKKPKNITREQWKKENNLPNIDLVQYKYWSNKAKKFLRQYNDKYREGKSEFIDEYSNGSTVHMHHIFPESEYPEISMYYENIIALTPTQHLGFAHPKNNTQLIDTTYQELLLKAKTSIIEHNINLVEEEKIIYTFDNLVEVLNVGFDEDNEVEEKDFMTIYKIITNYYLKL